MKALSLDQPWASLLAGGPKQFETRAWRTNYRGRIAIHATKKLTSEALTLTFQEAFARSLTRLGYLTAEDLPLGCIIGTATIVDMIPAMDVYRKIAQLERTFGNYTMGRWAWQCADPVLFKTPIPCRGMQGLWTVPEALLVDIEKQRSQA